MSDTCFHGMYRAIVMDNKDPERRARVRVQCPAVLGDYLSAWCEPCIPYATDFAGDYYVPPVGEGIWVQFEDGNVNKPIWNGGWYRTDSTPLTQDSDPEEFRFIIFKDSVMRMGQNEFIFEIRNADGSHTVTISEDTWMGLNYISSYDEDKILDLETLVANKEWLLATRPKEVNEALEELGNLIADLSRVYNDFTQNVFPDSVNSIYDTIERSYNTSHGELVDVVNQINSMTGDIDYLKSEIRNAWNHIGGIKNNIKRNVDRVNQVFGWLDAVKIDGTYMFSDYTPKLDKDNL